jgi:hypothetical protein
MKTKLTDDQHKLLNLLVFKPDFLYCVETPTPDKKEWVSSQGVHQASIDASALVVTGCVALSANGGAYIPTQWGIDVAEGFEFWGSVSKGVSSEQWN